jgi:hypothetical protein
LGILRSKDISSETSARVGRIMMLRALLVCVGFVPRHVLFTILAILLVSARAVMLR